MTKVAKVVIVAEPGKDGKAVVRVVAKPVTLSQVAA